MNRLTYVRLLCLSILLSAVFAGGGFAATTNNFAGNWVLKLGNRVLMAVVLEPAPGSAGSFTGWLARPRHFKSSGAGEFFSGIQGPVVRYPIVQSSATGNCLAFTTRNPADKTDRDHFRLCLGAPGHATLGIDTPTIEPLPLARVKGPVTVATDWNSARTYFQDETSVSNPEMRRIFEADQKDRQGAFGKIDWAMVSIRDAAHRKQVRQLLAEGKLHTGKDFLRAAFIFQHGGTPDDYLLAHTLAMIAVARGEGDAIWIAAASLDRYLLSIHQPQIYGTQFMTKPDGQATQEPYNRHLISDALRHDLGVPSQAEQKVQEKQYEKGGGK
ncbi:MAG: hypothetical protein P8Z30_19695 [Acidobacteriota bacterium]